MSEDPGPNKVNPKEVVWLADRVSELSGKLDEALASRSRAVSSAVGHFGTEEVLRQLERVPISALKDAGAAGLRVGALENSGIANVRHVVERSASALIALPGIGDKTASAVTAAANRLQQQAKDNLLIQIDFEQKPLHHEQLVSAALALHEFERKATEPAQRIRHLATQNKGDLNHARLETRRFRRFFAGTNKKDAAADAVGRLNDRLIRTAATAIVRDVDVLLQPEPEPSSTATWARYASNGAAVAAVIAEASNNQGVAEFKAVELSDAALTQVEDFVLDQTLLKVRLRNYQLFAAKYALQQRRTILGDEMGLGKTIEALAVLCHLAAKGKRHFMVVCPASVLTNWDQEIRRHSSLTNITTLHGPSRDGRMAEWVKNGGVALTTFGTLGSLTMPSTSLHCVVIDEAHYIKNPEAQRTIACARWLKSSEHALLMSGTPMENKPEEFRVLVSHVQPELARSINADAGLLGADPFRRQVAPVYLRRNQSEVLQELPDKIESVHWSPLTGKASAAYRIAVEDGNLMAMRRAAFASPASRDAGKLGRLLELVAEAEANSRKTIVFSFFLDVLSEVEEALGDQCIGRISGASSPAARQELVDTFTKRSGSCVLTSQIEAGGVGLNVQAASVVILCEPQWKPSTEEQAIARCFRMGQVNKVQVHRLLASNSIDDYVVELLAGKSKLFAEYARRSVASESSALATNSDFDPTKSLGEVETQILELERQRLGIAA